MVNFTDTELPGWKKSLERKKLKHNIAGAWTAVILNPIWLIVDYLSAPDAIWSIAAIDLSVSLFILMIILLHKKLRMSANLIAILSICALSIAASYVSCLSNLEEFQKLMMSHTAIFIGAGMLVLIEMKYSILIVVLSLIANVLFYIAFSTLGIQEYLVNGGLLVLLVAVFMIITIQVRYRLNSRAVSSKLILKAKQSELIEAKQVAEKSKDLQSQFLSNMSHEIRTPMNGIMGITRVLQDTKIDNEQRHYLNAILRSSENLMLIINDILDFSKIEAGKIEIEKTRFNLDELLIVVQEILVVSAQEKGLYLRLDKDESVPSWLEGDPVRLNQIMMNLIGNAIKFTNKGGVTLKVRSRKEDENNISLLFQIIDTGIGIPADKIDTIFQSFTQASSSTTRKHGGTGLGLTITKQLVELQDGNLWIASEEGKGSAFNFEIQYEKSTPNEETELVLQINDQKSTQNTLNDLKGTKILLVEDHPINQMLATKVLEDWGFDIDLAENGVIALEKIQENDHYALILMDISMPEMDGYTCTREIRTGNYTSNPEIPIIAMTASAFIGENQKCYKAGMNDYVSKPFNPQELLAKITNHMSNYLKSA
jgi:signal transduction histidine kinase/ActR/RegA family two-component response regulator